MTYDSSGGYPDLAAVRAWVQVPATAVDDAQLDKVCGAEQSAQLALVVVVEGELLDDALYQSFLRRVARHLATRNVPLGLIGADAEYGAVRLSRWDSEVERLEAPHRETVLG